MPINTGNITHIHHPPAIVSRGGWLREIALLAIGAVLGALANQFVPQLLKPAAVRQVTAENKATNNAKPDAVVPQAIPDGQEHRPFRIVVKHGPPP